jgi:hypothetical protein
MIQKFCRRQNEIISENYIIISHPQSQSLSLVFNSCKSSSADFSEWILVSDSMFWQEIQTVVMIMCVAQILISLTKAEEELNDV